MLREHLLATVEIDRTALDDAVEAAVSADLNRTRLARDRPGAAERLVDEMVRRRELAEDILVHLLRQGEVALFEVAFQRATRLRAGLAHRLLYDPGGEGLAIAAKAAGFGREVFVEVYRLTRLARPDGGREDPRTIRRLGVFFDRLPRRTAAVVTRHWRRNPKYLYALARIGESDR